MCFSDFQMVLLREASVKFKDEGFLRSSFLILIDCNICEKF